MNDVPSLIDVPVGELRQAHLKSASFALSRLLTLTAILAATSAMAQGSTVLPEVELDRLTLDPGATGSLLLGTGELAKKDSYRFSFTGHYAHDPLALFEDGTRVGSVVKYRLTGHLAGAYSLSDRLELSAQVPLVLVQGGDDVPADAGGPIARGPVLGTPYAGLRLGLLSQRNEGDVVDLAVGVNAGLPLGSAEALARDSSLRAIPSIMVGRRLGPLHAALDVGVLLRPLQTFSKDSDVRDEVGDELRLGAALSTTGEGPRGELDLIAYLPFRREASSVEALAGGRLPLSESLEGYVLAGMGFNDAPGTPTFRGLLGVAFGRSTPLCVAGGKHTPEQCPDLDDDNDKVPNRADACPLQGGRVDARGCPFKDGDGDGVLDPDDRCPTVAGVVELQGCPDADKDGIEDAADKCPKVFGVAAFQGCPDTDHDGLQDSEDKCPTEAGPADRQGCPLRDTDKDGIVDEKDDCPTVAGIPEMRGCPAKDTDGDKVEDHLDVCVNEPGLVEFKGCRKQPDVIIKTGGLELRHQVYFDTGKATIQLRSNDMLDLVAKILIEHPAIEKLWIEGHTDDQGQPAKNQTLSQQRAEAVRDYLVKKGVKPERLDAKGFGQQYPIADNKTKTGRAANRRVEFNTKPREDAQK